MKTKAIFFIAITSLLFACQSQTLTGKWQIVELKPGNFFSGVMLSLEKNAIYSFSPDGKFSIRKTIKDIDGHYTVQDNHITIKRVFDNKENSIEKHEILEWSNDKLILKDLALKDIRIFMKI